MSNPYTWRDDFEALTYPHLRDLHGFARRLTRNDHDAEDLIQESYLRAYRFFDKFERGTNVRAWLYRLVKNTFINEHRRRKARPDTVDFETVAVACEARMAELLGRDGDDPENALEATLLGEDIADALGETPDDFRLVVELCLIEGFTYREAADILEIPVGTVMSRLHRGRKVLQSRLLERAAERGLGTSAPARPGSSRAVSGAGARSVARRSPERPTRGRSRGPRLTPGPCCTAGP